MQTNTQHRSAAQPFLSEENVIFTNKAPLPLGAYSQGIKVSHGQTIYLSAQTPVSALNNEVLAQDFEGQLRQTLDNLAQMAQATGGSLANVVKVTAFITDLNEFPTLNRVMAEVLHQAVSGPYHCRSQRPGPQHPGCHRRHHGGLKHRRSTQCPSVRRTGSIEHTATAYFQGLAMNNWYREYVLQCLVCDRSYRPIEVSYYCPHCKIDGALDTLYDYASLKREWSRDSLAHHQARGMWRYDRLMPLRSTQIHSALAGGEHAAVFAPGTTRQRRPDQSLDQG